MCLAIPGKMIELFPGMPYLATVEVAGVRRKVDLGLLENRYARDRRLGAHPRGFAMSKISEQDALEQMQTLHHAGRKRASHAGSSRLRARGNGRCEAFVTRPLVQLMDPRLTMKFVDEFRDPDVDQQDG